MTNKNNSDLQIQDSINASLKSPDGTQFTLGWVTRKTAIGSVLQFFTIFFMGLVILAFKYSFVINFIYFFILGITIYIVVVTFTKSDLLHDTGYLLGRKQAPIGDKKITQLDNAHEESTYQPITRIKTISARAKIINPNNPTLGDKKI